MDKSLKENTKETSKDLSGDNTTEDTKHDLENRLESSKSTKVDMSKTGEVPKKVEVVVRSQWGNHIEFFLTSLGLAVGLGNLWRFPYVCYSNGGGTFLIPYFLSLFLIGLPLFLMEMILGQYAGRSCTIVYRRLVPGLKGLGYGMLSANLIINFYYAVIMAWAFVYMFEGWRSELPWTHCNPEFGTANCYSQPDAEVCNVTETYWNFSCTHIEEFCTNFNFSVDPSDLDGCRNETSKVELRDVTMRYSPSEEFYNHYVLGLKDLGESTWEDYGDPNWKVIGALAISWTIVALGLIKGVASYGKLSYFITLFPYIVLTIFLIFVSQEDGFYDGIDFYLRPDWERLKDSQVWLAAMTQIFYSLGVSLGCQLLLSSYNNFHANCHRDALLIAFGNSATSIYAGFIVFGTLGMLAKSQGVEVKDVVSEGTGLAFQAYPAAVTIMKVPPVFSFMFFFMLMLLAMSTISASWEPVVAAILDDFPNLRAHKKKVYFICCAIGFLCGLSCCFPSGYFMFVLLDSHISNSIIYLAFLELISIAWFYGIHNFMKNIEEMKIWMPRPFRWFYMGLWTFFIPAALLAMIYTLLSGRAPDQAEGYIFPEGIQIMGWLIEMLPLSLVIVGAVYTLIKYTLEGDLGKKSFFRPGPDWGPRPDRPQALAGIANEAIDDDDDIHLDIEKKVEKKTSL